MRYIIKICPFCGGVGVIKKHTFITDMSKTYGIECNKCKARTQQFYETEDEAIKAWNKRV